MYLPSYRPQKHLTVSIFVVCRLTLILFIALSLTITSPFSGATNKKTNFTAESATQANTQAKSPTQIERYTAKLRQKYGYSDGAKAQPINLVIIHINQLLKQTGTLEPTRESLYPAPFSQQVSREKDQLITTTTLYQAPQMRLQKRANFSVPGINPFLEHRCSPLDKRCWILHPATKRPWLELTHDKALTREIAQALSMAILLLQKNA